ncbi:MAG TPA: DoxX family protein [Terriglobales bacterium]
MLKLRTIGYWVTTAIIEFELLVGGITDLIRGRAVLVAGEPVVDIVAQLGYPAYLLTIIGTWKLLAGVALVVPGFPRLKEWAYAGIFFEMTGAAASWIATGDKTGQFIAPLFFAVIAMGSWALRSPSRTLGILFPSR